MFNATASDEPFCASPKPFVSVFKHTDTQFALHVFLSYFLMVNLVLLAEAYFYLYPE